jgi:hypothetical protein
MRDLNGVWITAFLDDLTLRFIIVREQGVLCVTFDSMQLLLKSCKAAFSFFMGLGCVICFTGVGEWHQFWQEHRIPRTWQLGDSRNNNTFRVVHNRKSSAPSNTLNCICSVKVVPAMETQSFFSFSLRIYKLRESIACTLETL